MRALELLKSVFMRSVPGEYVKDRRTQRFMTRMREAAAHLDAQEARSIAQEALPLDNESLFKWEDSNRQPSGLEKKDSRIA